MEEIEEIHKPSVYCGSQEIMEYWQLKHRQIRVIFVVWDLYSECFGVLQLSSFLKKYNYDVVLSKARIHEIERSIISSGVNVLAFSVPTVYASRCLMLADIFKKKYSNIIIIAGGPHPTLYPEFIYHRNIDIICRGEGEYAMLDLLRAVHEGDPVMGIKNLWVKDSFGIYKNSLRPFIKNLDELPYPDRSFYYLFFPHILRRMSVIFSRGCLFNCLFCMNAALRKLYNANTHTFFRIRTPNHSVEEMAYLKEKFRCKEFFIHDDIFGYDIRWLREFIECYVKEVNLPFHCNMHASYVTDERLEYLKMGNCKTITIGIESASDYVRNKVMFKAVTSEKIVESARLISSHGMSVRTTAIFGYPGNTLNDEWNTVRLNIRCKSRIFRGYLLSFYPGFYLQHKGTVYKWDASKFIAKSDGIGWVLWPKANSKRVFRRQKKLLALCHIIVKFPYLFTLRNVLMRLPLGWVYFVLVKMIRFYVFLHFVQKRRIGIIVAWSSVLFFIKVRINNIMECIALRLERRNID